ncbi:DUF3592 domain-containing protein [Opitutaceae bacterium]|nr:DUF3592 domain-containing protein [Opitutaceae bacterium]
MSTHTVSARLPAAARFTPPILILVGIIVTAYGANKVWLGYQSSNWPQTPGIVRSIGVEESYKTEKSGSGSHRYKVYEAQLTYDYQVAGRSYTGDRISFGHGPTRQRHPVQSVVDGLPIGSGVTVYYQPDNPSQSVLLPGGFELRPWGFVAVGIVFFFGGFWVALKNRQTA